MLLLSKKNSWKHAEAKIPIHKIWKILKIKFCVETSHAREREKNLSENATSIPGKRMSPKPMML